MKADGLAARTASTVCLLLQLVLVVGVPLADATHRIGRTDHRPHLEAEAGAPCAPGHEIDCQLARAIATGGALLPTTAVAAPAGDVADRVRPVTLRTPVRGPSVAALGPRAPPTA